MKKQRIYPQAGRIFLDGGLNNKFERSIIQDNESPDCANVRFSYGAVETRGGTNKLNTTAIGSFGADGIYTRTDTDGSETMVVFAGGTAWQLGGTTFTTIASAQSLWTAGVRVCAAEYENHLFIGNGSVIPYKYNGTDFTRHGVYPPVSTHTVVSQATGSLTGDYLYKVTFVNTNLVEGDVGPVSTTFTAASATLRLTSIPVAPQSWGVNARRIYRTEAGGTAFKRVYEIEDNTTATYDDNAADAALGVTAPTDNGVPPSYSVVVTHKDRLFFLDPANPNRVGYTELGDPYTVGALNFRNIGDVCRTLSVYQDSILVGCDKSNWLIYMPDTDPTNWSEVRINGSYGCKSPFAMVEYKDKMLFPAIQGGKLVGFAAVAGTAVDTSATLLTIQGVGSDMQSDRIEPSVYDIQDGYIGRISGVVFKNRAYLAVTHGAAQTKNNRIWVMDFSISNLSKSQKEVWSPDTGLYPEQFTIYDDKLYYVSSVEPCHVYEMETSTYNDSGSAIDSYFWSKEFSGYKQDINYHKDFRFGNFLVEKLGAYYMNVVARVDSDKGDGQTFQIHLDPGGSLWGVMEWGTDSWGGGNKQDDYQLDLGTLNGKRIQFKFSNQNTVNQGFKVHGMNLTYNLKGIR